MASVRPPYPASSWTDNVAVFHKIGEPSKDHMINSVEQIIDFALKGGLVTFDGAYKSLWENRNKLYNIEPILFIQGNTVGTDGVMDWNEIMELRIKYGFTLGWHGWSHRRLTELEDRPIQRELWSPILMDVYAYPHGDWDDRVAKLVREAGYLRAYSTTQGVEGNDFAIPRQYL